ncbi:MAG TPA: succinate dehydrogenase [Salinarimonas sp.]|jgi:fumarate reductase subunit C|nr:succinate dehydrogenase [Salinarimonas sp.]
MNVRLYLWQRGTAMVMVPLLLVHLAVIFYATRQGLTAADILARTRGSVTWALFYAAFVGAAAVHASIGLRNILVEWTGLRARGAALAGTAFGVVLTALGLRAIAAVVLP